MKLLFLDKQMIIYIANTDEVLGR